MISGSDNSFLKTGVKIVINQSAYGAFHLPKPISPDEKVTGKRLAQLRKSKGFTQSDLSDQLGVTQSMISDYENGVMRLHADLLIQLAKLLKISTDEILGLKLSKQTMRPHNKRLTKRLEALEKLPKRDMDALLRTIDAFVERAH